MAEQTTDKMFYNHSAMKETIIKFHWTLNVNPFITICTGLEERS